MSLPLTEFLQGQPVIAESYPVWLWRNVPLPLHQRTYLCATMPPDALISSARAILFRHNEVLVIRDHLDTPHIIPGGRRNPRETVLETLRRELREETGWSFRGETPLGFAHFQHLGPKPAGYPYPYPHFFWAIFAANADSFDPAGVKEDEYVTQATFRPVSEVSTWNLSDGQSRLLQAAFARVFSVNSVAG